MCGRVSVKIVKRARPDVVSAVLLFPIKQAMDSDWPDKYLMRCGSRKMLGQRSLKWRQVSPSRWTD